MNGPTGIALGITLSVGCYWLWALLRVCWHLLKKWLTPPAPPPAEPLITRLRKRATIRRGITTRKSVQEGKPDRLADLLDEAATRIDEVEFELRHMLPIYCLHLCRHHDGDAIVPEENHTKRCIGVHTLLGLEIVP